jgi:hypothetical protein
MGLEQAFSTLYDSAGVEVGTAGNPIRTDPTGTTTQPVNGTVTANQGTAAAIGSAWPTIISDGVNPAAVLNAAPGAAAYGLVVRIAGSVPISFAKPSTATVTSVAMTTVVATLLALNLARDGALLWNEGTADVYVKLGAAATTASYSLILRRNSYYELPSPSYTGLITGITAAGTATVLVTEITV